ncbi:hypothetical protein AAFF_G00430470 [Aldrovandia affinis]|uniref:Uncharacterized protein n=1 Tax=Aldrovandia affinis TaxID=143900 RepID=A0AAD7WIM1_9TELE|nr:hypothetical protein AAFF_G00430470 [Aldrovandia affinis]
MERELRLPLAAFRGPQIERQQLQLCYIWVLTSLLYRFQTFPTFVLSPSQVLILEEMSPWKQGGVPLPIPALHLHLPRMVSRHA